MPELQVTKASRFVGFLGLFFLLAVGVLEALVWWGVVPIIWEAAQLVALGLALLCGLVSAAIVTAASAIAWKKAASEARTQSE